MTAHIDDTMAGVRPEPEPDALGYRRGLTRFREALARRDAKAAEEQSKPKGGEG